MQEDFLKNHLVSGGYGCGVMKDHDVPLELPAWLGVELGADHDHPFPDLAPLDLLEGEWGSLARLDLRHRHPFPVDGLDGDGVEMAQGVGPQ